MLSSKFDATIFTCCVAGNTLGKYCGGSGNLLMDGCIIIASAMGIVGFDNPFTSVDLTMSRFAQ